MNFDDLKNLSANFAVYVEVVYLTSVSAELKERNI